MERLGFSRPPGSRLHTDISGYFCFHGDLEAGGLLDLDPFRFQCKSTGAPRRSRAQQRGTLLVRHVLWLMGSSSRWPTSQQTHRGRRGHEYTSRGLIYQM